MTYNEYEKWAEDYLHEAQALERKISKRRRKVYFISAEERERNERAVKQLYEMHSECMATYRLLMNRASELKERTANA